MRVDRLEGTRRALVVIALAGSALAVWPSSQPYALPKATLLLAAALIAAAVGAWRVILTGRVQVPLGWVPAAMLATIGAMTIATATSVTPVVSFMGATRQTGLVTYAACFILALAVLAEFRKLLPTVLVWGLLVAAAVVTVYGLLQVRGVQPLPFGAFTTPVFATLGNSNFLSGWLAVVAPLWLWLALSRATGRRGWALRAAGGVFLLLGLWVSYRSKSFQGLPAAAVGCSVVLAAWAAFGRPGGSDRLLPVQRRWVLLASAALVLAAVASVAATGWVGDQIESGIQPRLDYWSAAARMFGDHPLTGTGPDTFEQFYPSYYERVSSFAYEVADNPHSVPLAMLTSGGVLLGAAYAALVVATAAALWLGLRRAQGEGRWLLAGLGGAWAAYQVQSLVSIDIPPLAVAHWVLAAAIATLAGTVRFREVTVRQVRPVARPQRRRGGRPRPLPAPARLAVWAVAVFLVAGLWLGLRPMRAVAAADRAEDLLDAARVPEGEAAAREAAALGGWQARNWFLVGRAAERAGDLDGARESLARAIELAPGSGAYLAVAADLALKAQDHDAVLELYRRAYEADPRNRQVVAGTVRALLLYGERDEALPIVRAALAERETAELWGLKGRLHALDDRVDLAFMAYRRALRLDPDHGEAAAYLRGRGT